MPILAVRCLIQYTYLMSTIPEDTTESVESLRERDALALAQLIYDIYIEKKTLEKKGDNSGS